MNAATMTAPVLAEKSCAKCGETKPLSEFYRNKRARDGRMRICSICDNAGVKERREQRLAEDPEAERLRHLRRVQESRARTGNERGKAQTRARNRAIRALIDAHPDEFEQRLRIAKHEAGLL